MLPTGLTLVTVVHSIGYCLSASGDIVFCLNWILHLHFQKILRNRMNISVCGKSDVAQTCVALAEKSWLRSVKNPLYLEQVWYQGLKSA